MGEVIEKGLITEIVGGQRGVVGAKADSPNKKPSPEGERRADLREKFTKETEAALAKGLEDSADDEKIN